MKTRRILSLVVAAILVVSTLCVVGLLNVTASETEITSAEQFATITDGNYKLMADIDLTTVEFTTIASFTGTIDGNGKTVTTSAPLFGALAGEVRSLTIAGTITTDATTAIGALANTAGGALTVTGVTNKASVTTAASASVGGFIGEVTGTNAVTFAGSANDGAITATGVVTGAGGFVGTVIGSAKDAHASVTVEKSVNNGAVTLNSTGTGYAGAGGFVGSGDKYTLNFTESANYGAIDYTNGANGGPAGFFGTALKWESGKDNSRDVLTVRYCANYGDITAHSNVQGPAGIVGRLNRGMNMTYTFEYCYNVGKITGGNYAAGILAYTNNSTGTKLTVKGCYSTGNWSDSSYYHPIGLSGSLKPQTTSGNNFYVGETALKTNENYYFVKNKQATKCDDQTALNTALVALGEYIVDETVNDGYAILKWQCPHTTSESNCTGSFCVLCGEKTADIAGEHAWGTFVETTPATVTTDGVETSTCSKCGETQTRAIPATGTITPADGVYNVYTENELLWLSYNMNAGKVPANAKIAIKADITLQNGMTYINKTFTGTFDGEDHTISGLDDIIFAKLAGVFKNVTLEGEIVSNLQRVGAIACETPTGGGAHISNVHSKVDIKATYAGGNHGGIIGYTLGYCTIIDCTYSGTLTITTGSSAIGGIVGYTNRAGATNPVIDGCVFDGAIVLEGNCDKVVVGGIYGNHNAKNGGDQIRNCVVSGSIVISEETTACQVGGIAGGYRNTQGNTSVIENCVFNGTITGNGTIGAIAGNLNSMSLVQNTVALTTDYPICPVEGGTIINSFAAADVVKYGDEPFELGGVKYQRYNFGYLNADTMEFVSAGLVTDAYAGYLQTRANGETHDVRVVIVANEEALTAAKVTITFTKADATVATFEATLGADGDLQVFKAGVAAGEPFFAGEGCALFGAVVTGIPNGAWDSVSVSITSGEEVLFNGGTTYAQ